MKQKDLMRLALLLLFACGGWCGTVAATTTPQEKDSVRLQKDFPQSGEGIYAFLRRHGMEGGSYVKAFIALNKARLGKDNALLTGFSYILPPVIEKPDSITPPKAEMPAVKTPKDTVRKDTVRKDTVRKDTVRKDTVVKSVAVKDTVRKDTVAKQKKPEAPSAKGKKKESKGYEPLFGEQLAAYDIESSELSGACFYIVSGHGGPDPGAIGKMGAAELHEDEYAYDIALRLARNLLIQGATVHIIIQDKEDGIRDDRILSHSKRETCGGKRIPAKQSERLRQRCDLINDLYQKEKPAYSRALFIHLDSRSVSMRMDVFFYHSRHSEQSEQTAWTMRNVLADKYGKNRPGLGFSGTVQPRGLYVLEHTVPTAIFAELGNIQHYINQERFVKSNNRQALANWFCEGFVVDYKRHKK